MLSLPSLLASNFRKKFGPPKPSAPGRGRPAKSGRPSGLGRSPSRGRRGCSPPRANRLMNCSLVNESSALFPERLRMPAIMRFVLWGASATVMLPSPSVSSRLKYSSARFAASESGRSVLLGRDLVRSRSPDGGEANLANSSWVNVSLPARWLAKMNRPRLHEGCVVCWSPDCLVLG